MSFTGSNYGYMSINEYTTPRNVSVAAVLDLERGVWWGEKSNGTTQVPGLGNYVLRLVRNCLDPNNPKHFAEFDQPHSRMGACSFLNLRRYPQWCLSGRVNRYV